MTHKPKVLGAAVGVASPPPARPATAPRRPLATLASPGVGTNANTNASTSGVVAAPVRVRPTTAQPLASTTTRTPTTDLRSTPVAHPPVSRAQLTTTGRTPAPAAAGRESLLTSPGQSRPAAPGGGYLGAVTTTRATPVLLSPPAETSYNAAAYSGHSYRTGMDDEGEEAMVDPITLSWPDGPTAGTTTLPVSLVADLVDTVRALQLDVRALRLRVGPAANEGGEW